MVVPSPVEQCGQTGPIRPTTPFSYRDVGNHQQAGATAMSNQRHVDKDQHHAFSTALSTGRQQARSAGRRVNPLVGKVNRSLTRRCPILRWTRSAVAGDADVSRESLWMIPDPGNPLPKNQNKTLL